MIIHNFFVVMMLLAHAFDRISASPVRFASESLSQPEAVIELSAGEPLVLAAVGVISLVFAGLAIIPLFASDDGPYIDG
ncbi:MAG: hypothetical protein GX491_12530 [Chloroflexi bacterium]|nr:hypothetical protein [Chloroflexota bacterium]